LGQAAPEDLVTYLMVTAEVRLPDALISKVGSNLMTENINLEKYVTK